MLGMIVMVRKVMSLMVAMMRRRGMVIVVAETHSPGLEV